MSSQRRISTWLLASLVILMVGPAAVGQRLAVKVKKAITPDGVVASPIVLIEDGKIRAVTADASKVPSGYRHVDRSKHTMAPGMIDVASLAGALFDLTENAAVIDENCRAVDALNPTHRDFELLVRSGVTTVLVSPGNTNLVGGRGVVVKTAGAGDRVVGDGPVKLALASDVYNAGRLASRFPTSFIGARKLLRETLDGAKKNDGKSPICHLVRGRLPGLAWVRTRGEILAMTDLAKKNGMDVSLIGAAGIRKVLPALKGSGFRVALAPLSFTSSRAQRSLPAIVAKAGLRVAFYGDTPRNHPELLRISAALAARQGLSAKAALASVTSTPAAMAGVAKRVGSIEVGRDADFILFDGDGPLDLTAQIAEVWIEGRRVHSAKDSKESRR